jgi:multiple sugar transport system ATP-binding protein
MDEPLSNLDAKLRGHMRAELKHMQHELGITTIYVTHDQIEAMTLAHRVAVLERGVLQQLDTPATIYNRPANLFVAGFIGSPPMNLLNGRLTEGRFESASGSFGTLSRASVSAAVAGLRPEDCHVTAPDGGKLAGSIYATELIGDHTLVTCRCGDATLTTKAAKDFSQMIGDLVGIAFDEHSVHLFDEASGDRIS